jgi:tellurite resistance protein TerC
MFDHPGAWTGFAAFVLTMLALDLGVFHRKAHVVKFREAISWVIFWVFLALLFAVWIYFERGAEQALMFVTGYLIEQSLSVDNLFVFVLIFQTLKTPPIFQHRILFWGIVGAFLMRAVFIFAGVALVQRFHWMVWVFGAFLVYTGAKLAFHEEEDLHPEDNPVLKFFKRWFPVTHLDGGGRFFVRIGNKLYATSLFIALILVETTDLIFATDSIPAILAISTDPFIVYTSNVFAILGLRALYFALSGVMDLFRFLKYGLSVVLIFVGAKMLATAWDIKVPIVLALSVVGGILALSVLASLVLPDKGKAKKPAALASKPAPKRGAARRRA